MNVLILSAAAKVLLVQAFQAAARPLGGQVIAADIARDNAALFAADQALILPRSDDPGFAGALADACARHGVGLIVPTRDGELAVLAAARERLHAQGVTVLVPSQDALALCRDKRRFAQVCHGLGLATPRTFAPGEAPDRYPVFVRPVDGAGGRGARRVDGPADLPAGEDHLVQAFDDGPEFTIDVLMSLDGAPLQALARRRLLVHGGEATKSRTEDIPALADQALKLCAALGLVGHNVVQAFHDAAGTRFIEVNPRFGGASNLSIQAGLASPERILQMARGRTAEAARPRPIAYGLTMLRYAQDRIVTDAELAAL
ncbi:ATP-grasp domain-containing protein [Phenylobacterium sp.]|uniref:ATP-grasp domain-containing protein n=1 Tax=Phenylobacterium sp. TaxID=1871053 RepID=UPI0028A00967|nr:ATP-grasp domain-containing protein [Phenylobacterium sp.]